MPTRADVVAATPKCPLWHEAGRTRCGAVLRVEHRGCWTCPLHGMVRYGDVLPPPLVASSARP